MEAIGHEDEPAGVRYVSTGHLPAAGDVQRAVEEAYQRYRQLPGGRVAQVYPALARVPAGLWREV
jgi:glutaminase